MAMIPHKKLLLQLQCSPARYAIKATLCKWKSSCKALSAWPAVEQQTLACISALTHAEQNYAELRRAMQNHAELSRTMQHYEDCQFYRDVLDYFRIPPRTGLPSWAGCCVRTWDGTLLAM